MSDIPKLDRSHVEITTLHLQGSDSIPADLTRAERFGIVWPMTLDAWSFKDPTIAESRFQRHVIRVVQNRG